MKTGFPCENANTGKSCFNYRKSCFHYRNITNYTSNFSGDESVDQALKKHLNIMAENPSEAYPNINSVWDKFNKVFGALFSLLSYVPVTKDYFYQAFTEFKEDNVQYLEFRTVLPSLCPNM